MKIFASIITYNPDIKILRENIKAVITQVDCLYVFENGSKNSELIHELCKEFNAVFINNFENLGISKSLNKALDLCKKNGGSWLLTLDQDSICDDRLIEEYKKMMLKYPNVVSFTPEICDRNLENKKMKTTEEFFVNSCITSGNLINVDYCLMIGGFDETYFIDCVDFDLSATIIVSGGKILKVPSTYISHAVGEAKKHSFFGRELISYNHSAFRNYYIVRNSCYFKNKYKRNSEIKKQKHPLIKQCLIVILYEKDKINKLKMCFRGYSSYRDLIRRKE